MKNFCILLACLTVLSAMPSFAMKVIVNNNNDRIVYSRSTLYEKDNFVDEYYIQKHNEELAKSSYLKSQNPQKYEHEMNMLGDDFRLELAGTKWNYMEEEVPVANVETQVVQKEDPNFGLYQRGSREAADYYYIDFNKDPNNAIQSGYSEI